MFWLLWPWRWFQKKVTDALDKLCSHLPPHLRNTCTDDVNRMLPVAITFLTTIVVRFSLWHSVIARAKATTDDWKPLSLPDRNLPMSARSLASVAPMSNSGTSCSSIWSRSRSSLLPRPRVSVSLFKLQICLCLFGSMFLTSCPPPSAGSVLRPLLLLPLPDQDSRQAPPQGQDWGVLRPGLWAATLTDAKFSLLHLHLSSSLLAGSRHPPAGEDLQDSAALPQRPMRVCDQQV